MPHPLVTQLRFARSELLRGIAGVSDGDARRRFGQMNSISWTIGHLAAQEQRNWLTRAQEQTPFPELQTQFGYGAAASAPALDEVLAAWHAVVPLVDRYLDTLTTADLQRRMSYAGTPTDYAVGTILQRHIYHYWFHLGECMAIRQLLGHAELPEFVGDIHAAAPYEPG